MSLFMPAQVLSQEPAARCRSTLWSHASLGRSSSASALRTTSSGVLAISTSPFSPYGRTTSLIGVDTTGTPAARNSGVLVGEMNFVASFRAKGIKPMSQRAR